MGMKTVIDALTSHSTTSKHVLEERSAFLFARAGLGVDQKGVSTNWKADQDGAFSLVCKGCSAENLDGD